MPPKALAKSQGDRSSGAPGVLPVPASARATAQKNQNVARLKLEVRRLPPGLTIHEFDDVLGPEWRLGGGKVDWREFRQGKIRKSNKLPEMGRCYVHVTNENLVREFEKRFLGVKFEDQAGTFKDRDIRNMGWLPQLGFAPNQRVPAMGRQRQDQRQGTIDQDPEFMAFLEGETQIIAKPATVDAASEREKDAAEVKSTPLIDDLRERKAKAEQKKKEGKEGGGKGKHSKGESKDATATEKEGKGGQAQKGDQAAKGSKGSNKQGGAKQAQANANAQNQATTKGGQSPAKSKRQQSTAAAATAAAVKSPKPQNATPTPSSPATSRPSSSQGPASQRGQPARQRGNAEGIKKMLQKDLGLQPKGGQGRQQRASQTTSNNTTPSATPSNAASQPSEIATTAAKSTTAQPAPQQAAAQTAQPSQASSASSTKAYLKHANPSQGITEILLQTTLSRLYGPVSNVTIDPRKGTAIAVFKETTDLKKAIEAKKVQIATGAVEIVEWKERSAGGSGGGSGWGGSRGGFRGSRGGRGGRAGGGSSNSNGNSNGSGGGGGGSKSAAPANASSGT